MIVARPGYFGKDRTQWEEMFNARYGPGNWQECWQLYDEILPFNEAVRLYDVSYFLHIKEDRYGVFHGMACQYKDCYDNDPSNIEAGCNHDLKAVPRHIQDVSVRRAFRALGIKFNPDSDKLLEIRGEGSSGYELSPMRIPFIYPFAIIDGPARDWVGKGTVEEFWQRNKVIICCDK